MAPSGLLFVWQAVEGEEGSKKKKKKKKPTKEEKAEKAAATEEAKKKPKNKQVSDGVTQRRDSGSPPVSLNG